MHRAAWVAMGLCGLLLMAALALLGRDLSRSCRHGPFWRRRALAAALALLALAGLEPASAEDATPAAPAPARPPTSRPATQPARADIRQTEAWQRIETVWRESHELHPDKRAEINAAAQRVLDLRQDVQRLREMGLLEEAEVFFLGRSVEELAGLVRSRPALDDGPLPTCYVMPPQHAIIRGTAEALLQRLSLLAKVREGLPATVVEKVLAALETDLAALREDKEIDLISDRADRTMVRQVRAVVQAQMQRIRGQAVTGPLSIGYRKYEVRQGDTLWSIAARELGDGQRHRDILRMNPDLKPQSIRPGQVILLPEK